MWSTAYVLFTTRFNFSELGAVVSNGWSHIFDKYLIIAIIVTKIIELQCYFYLFISESFKSATLKTSFFLVVLVKLRLNLESAAEGSWKWCHWSTRVDSPKPKRFQNKILRQYELRIVYCINKKQVYNCREPWI